MVFTESYAVSVGTTVGILFITRLLFQLISRRFFHPLSSVPGPWINGVSELPATLALVTGNQHLYYRSLHEKYGAVVRVSPDEVSFVSVEAREEIYGHRKGGPLMEKSPIFLGAVGNVGGETGVSLALNEEHARQRRALGYLFTNSALLQHESIIRQHIQKLMQVFEKMATEDRPVNFTDWYTYLTFDVMGDLCFAEPFGCLDQASATTWSTSVVNVFVAATWTQGIRRISGVGTWLEKILLKIFVPSKAAEWRTIHLDNSRAKTLQRLAEGDGDHPDFMHQILTHQSKKTLSPGEIILNIALFISAGTDTTATVLTGWTYFICTHPKVYQRLIAEVTEAFTSTSEIRWEKAMRLQYLEATIYEAFRLFPPSAASQQRIVPAGGATIDGYYLPAGTTVAVSPWASTRSRLNFYEPDLFHPERWLAAGAGDSTSPDTDKSSKFLQDRLNASLPFGTGPRVCIGRNLAYMEIRLILAYLLFQYDFELCRDRGGEGEAGYDEYGERNQVWGLDGMMRPMKVFHSMTKPELWGRLKERAREVGGR